MRQLSLIELRCMTVLTRQVTGFATYVELLRAIHAGYVPSLSQDCELALALGVSLSELGHHVEWRG